MILANLKHSVVPTALVSALLLAGCVSPAVTQQVRGHIDSSMEAAGVMNRSLRVEESTLGHKAATNAAAARQLSPIVARRASRPWIGSEMIEISSEDSLPAIFDETFKLISFEDKSTGGKVSLAVWAERMSRITGVPFRIKQDVYSPAASAVASSPSTAQPAKPATATVAGMSMPAPLAAAGQASVEVIRPGPNLMLDTVEMDWKNNTPRGITEFVTARLGLSYAYRDGVIIIERYVTETFEIAALEGSKDFAMNLQGGSTSGASSTTGATGNSQSISASTKLDHWTSSIHS